MQVSPHINTVIIDIGSVYTRIGYAGDFHPIKVIETASLSKKIFIENSVITDINLYIKALEKVGKICTKDDWKGYNNRNNTLFTDSAIIIVHTTESDQNISDIKRILQNRRIFNSFLIMKSAICESFGGGKLTAVILSCSGGSSTITAISNGKIINCYKCEERIIGSERSVIDSDGDTESFTDINSIYSLIDKMMGFRRKNGSKKNMANCGIVLSGGIFKDKVLFEKCREYIGDRYGNGVRDSMAKEMGFELGFTGASIFGDNIESKVLFTK